MECSISLWLDVSPSTSGHRSYASISYGSVGLLFLSLSVLSPSFSHLYNISAPFYTRLQYSAMLVWVNDADNDGYWLTVYLFVQRLPVFLGILLLAGLRFSRLKAERIEITEVVGVYLCECVCLNRELWVSIDFIFFYVDLCSTLLNDWLVTLFCFVWHLNKVHLTLTRSAVQFLYFLFMFQNLHAHCPNINKKYLTRTRYGEGQKCVLQFVWISAHSWHVLFSIMQLCLFDGC